MPFAVAEVTEPLTVAAWPILVVAAGTVRATVSPLGDEDGIVEDAGKYYVIVTIQMILLHRNKGEKLYFCFSFTYSGLMATIDPLVVFFTITR
jgi:hypothetical protein